MLICNRLTIYTEKLQLVFMCWLVSFACCPSFADEPFMIKVVDRENGWPVPLVKLKTTSNVELISDNAGIIAFDLPELMDRETWLFVDGDGYQVKPDGFGFHGLRVTPQSGKSLTIEMDRTILSKRMGRLTGSGLFAESQKCGQNLQWRDQGIVGCDSIRLATHQGKLHWVWGDTGLPRYPLGLFHALGATTETQPLKKFEPPLMLRFDYFRGDNGIPRNTAVMPGEGPTWLDGVISLPDREGIHRLVCYYAKIKKPMNVYQSGLCVWNQDTKQFDKLKEIWNDHDSPGEPPPAPTGHVTLFNDDNNQTWALFGDPFPTMKCLATFEAWSDPQQWQQLKSPKKLKSIDGQDINVHRGSIEWNSVRNKWICVFGQVFGKPSMLGEIWYTESDSPFGPWSPALKILSHQNHSFYNPRIQTELMPDDAEFVLFEGTYTQTFSASPTPTPRYDYNQILYRVDFKDIDSAIDKIKKAQKKNSNE